MKKISKFMTAALAVVALASCSDELNLEKAAVEARQNADLVARLATDNDSPTRIGIANEVHEYGLDDGRLVDFDLYWSEGDQVRVFTLESQTYNTYKLDPATEGTVEGAFKKVGDFKTDLSGKLYAITEGQFVYSISPDPAGNENGDPLLTMTIPSSYDLDETYLDETGINKFPAPYWGEATVEDAATVETPGYDKQIQADLKGLTAFLRIDAKSLPIGTKAIVLTTHGAETHPDPWGVKMEGFQLVSEAEMLARWGKTPEQTTRDNWYDWYKSGRDNIIGGQSEPLSGTLNAILKEGAALQYSDLLVSRDTIRINLENIPEISNSGYIDITAHQTLTDVENADKVIYVPIVAGLYKDLHVIAVTGDSPFSYQWVGEEIQRYTDEVFKVNTIKQLIMKVNVDVSDCYTWQQLSDKIFFESMQNPGRTLNIDIPAAVVNSGANNPNKNYLKVDNELIHNDLVLNWPNGYDCNLTILEAKGEINPINGQVHWIIPADESVNEPAAAERYITLNLDVDDCSSIYEFITPTSIVTVGTNEGLNNKTANVMVTAAAFNDMVPNSTLGDPTIYPGVSGRDLVESGAPALMNRKNATVFIKNGIGSLDITNRSKGSVYIYSGGYQQTEIFRYLAIRTTEPMMTRLSDALVYNIWAVNSENNKRYVFTTGSSAIGLIQTLSSVSAIPSVIAPATAASEVPITTNPDALLPEAYTPKNFHVVAYWTGAALQEDNTIHENAGVIATYDKALVYTAAQLASAGEKTTSDYAIPAGVVTEMWLGGSYFPWIGAQVTVEKFKFNGMRVSLQNMQLDIEDKSFTDPHHCCTSCGEVRKINLDKNLGLFRSIISATSVELDSINLNDVFIETEEPINNIGSIAGLVVSPDVTMTKNQVGEVKIDVNGSCIGGMVGQLAGKEVVFNGGQSLGVQTPAKLQMDDNQVTSKDDDKDTGWIISDKDFVGGQIGLAIVSTANINNSLVSLKDQITAGSTTYKQNNPITAELAPYVPAVEKQDVSAAGGIVGGMLATAAVDFEKPVVEVINQIYGDEAFVGGIGGIIANPERTVKINEGKVTTKLIESDNNGYVGGGVGLLSDMGSTVTKNEVNVDEILADDNYVGGVAGRLDNKNADADFSGNKVKGNANAKAKIYTPEQNAGGLIGLSNLPKSGAILTIKDASVTASLIEATEGFAGGEIGEQHDGRVNIGEYATDSKLNTIIAVDKLSGAFALGGLVGDNNDPLYVYTNHKGSPTKTAYSDVSIAIGDWETKKTEDWYDADNIKDHAAGSMGNIVGYLDQTLTVQETNGDMHVTDKLNSAKKKEVFFCCHKNRKYTTDEYAYYWGDTNGYVGWGHSGNYTINGTGVNGDQTGKYNLYKPESVYDTTKSRWEPAN